MSEFDTILTDLCNNIYTLISDFSAQDVSNQINNIKNEIDILNTNIEGILNLYKMVEDISNTIYTNNL